MFSCATKVTDFTKKTLRRYTVIRTIAICVAVLLGLSLFMVLPLKAVNQPRKWSPAPVSVDWDLIKTGDVLTGSVKSEEGCIFPPTNVHTKRVQGKLRHVTLGQDDLCRVIVVDHGEVIKNSTLVKSSILVFRRIPAAGVVSRLARRLMLDVYTHEHFFAEYNSDKIMEVHSSMYFEYDGTDYAWIPNRQEGVNWFTTVWNHSQASFTQGDKGCQGDVPVHDSVSCWNSGTVEFNGSGNNASVGVAALGDYLGQPGCSGATGSTDAGNVHLYGYQCQ
jgi:hypothetical protein